MSDQPKASGIPAHVTFEDFDPLTGKADASKEEYYRSTFHTGADQGTDPVFNAKANLMESSGGEIAGEANDGSENATDKAQDAKLTSQTKEAAL